MISAGQTSVTPSTPATGADPLVELTEMNTTMMASGLASSAIQAIGGMIVGAIQLNMQRDAINHQFTMAKKTAKEQTDRIDAQDKLAGELKTFQKSGHKAAEDRASAEGDLKAAKTEMRELKKTKEAGAIDTGRLDRLFQRRGYSHGVTA